MQTYDELIADALRDVRAKTHHACGETPECRLLGGCGRCGWAVMRGESVGVRRVEIRGNVVTLTIDSDHGECRVAFSGVEVTVHA